MKVIVAGAVHQIDPWNSQAEKGYAYRKQRNAFKRSTRTENSAVFKNTIPTM